MNNIEIVIQVLKSAREKISDPEKWIKKGTVDHKNKAYCASAALIYAVDEFYRDNPKQAWRGNEPLYTAYDELAYTIMPYGTFRTYQSLSVIISYNDVWYRLHEGVLSKFDQTIARLTREELKSKAMAVSICG